MRNGGHVNASRPIKFPELPQLQIQDAAERAKAFLVLGLLHLSWEQPQNQTRAAEVFALAIAELDPKCQTQTFALARALLRLAQAPNARLPANSPPPLDPVLYPAFATAWSRWISAGVTLAPIAQP
jgi:hypothetical protein